MRRLNDTEAWKDANLDAETLAWVRKYVRAHEGQAEKALRAAAADTFEKTAEEGAKARKKRQTAAAEKANWLEAGRLCIDKNALKTISNADLETQIDKWRSLDPRTIPKSNLKVKEKLIKEILNLVGRSRAEGKLDAFLEEDRKIGERRETRLAEARAADQSSGGDTAIASD
jgi:hypothetical protein